jgi:hypothetical protein
MARKDIFFVGGFFRFSSFYRGNERKERKKNKKDKGKERKKQKQRKRKKDSFFKLRLRHLKNMKEKRK